MFVVALSLSVFTFTLLYERRSRGWCKVFGINEGQIEMMKMKLATGFDEVFGMKEEDFEKIRERLEMEERKKIALEESRTSRNLKSMTRFRAFARSLHLVSYIYLFKILRFHPMAGWSPPTWFFGAVAGGIAGLVLAIGLIGGLIKYMQGCRIERDLEANRTELEEKAASARETAQIAPGQMAQAAPRETLQQEHPDWRSDIVHNMETDPAFEEVDLRDPAVRSASIYTKIRRGFSRPRAGTRRPSASRARF
ncbi:MAG: hypothetical protein Q9201_000659 [Fulgogasparrea decipioides]